MVTTPITDAEPEPEVWNPFADLAEREFPLTSAGGRARVTFAPWTAGERIAYEDATATTLSLVGDDGQRKVRMGRMNALMVTSTLRGWEGFPATITRTTSEQERERAAAAGQQLRERVTERLDLRRLEHLELLPETVYAELIELASTVQPMPGQKRKTDTTGTGTVAPPPQDPELGDPDDVPSRALSTPPAAEAAGRAPAARGARG